LTQSGAKYEKAEPGKTYDLGGGATMDVGSYTVHLTRLLGLEEPTVTSATDNIRTVRESTSETVSEIGDGGRTKMLVAAGRLTDFRACFASVKRLPKKGLCIDREAAELLGVEVGDEIVVVPR